MNGIEMDSENTLLGQLGRAALVHTTQKRQRAAERRCARHTAAPVDIEAGV